MGFWVLILVYLGGHALCVATVDQSCRCQQDFSKHWIFMALPTSLSTRTHCDIVPIFTAFGLNLGGILVLFYLLFCSITNLPPISYTNLAIVYGWGVFPVLCFTAFLREKHSLIYTEKRWERCIKYVLLGLDISMFVVSSLTFIPFFIYLFFPGVFKL